MGFVTNANSEARFSYQTSGLSVIATCTKLDSETCSFDYGDPNDNSSGTFNTFHTYSTPGTYTITLTKSSCDPNIPQQTGCWETSSKQVTVTSSSSTPAPGVGDNYTLAPGITGEGVTSVILDSGLEPLLLNCQPDCPPIENKEIGASSGTVDASTSDNYLDDSDEKHGTTVTNRLLRYAPKTSVIAIDIVDREYNYSTSTFDAVPSAEKIEAALNYIFQLNEEEPWRQIAVVNISSALDTLGCVGSEHASIITSITNLTNKGISVVAASGNEGRTQGLPFPACIANVISVGASYEVGLPIREYTVGNIQQLMREYTSDVYPPSYVFEPIGFNDYAFTNKAYWYKTLKLDGSTIWKCRDSGVVEGDARCHSNIAPDIDIFAPGSSTSFSAPVVSAAIALLKSTKEFASELLDSQIITNRVTATSLNHVYRKFGTGTRDGNLYANYTPTPDPVNGYGTPYLYNIIEGDIHRWLRGSSSTNSEGNYYFATGLLEGLEVKRPPVDHATVTQTCDSSDCHSTVSAIHIASTTECDACHSVEEWYPALKVDHQQVNGACDNCHANENNENHIPTTDTCEACHSPIQWVPEITVDHNEVLGICETCHEYTYHIPADVICSDCHSTTSWQNANGIRPPLVSTIIVTTIITPLLLN